MKLTTEISKFKLLDTKQNCVHHIEKTMILKKGEKIANTLVIKSTKTLQTQLILWWYSESKEKVWKFQCRSQLYHRLMGKLWKADCILQFITVKCLLKLKNDLEESHIILPNLYKILPFWLKYHLMAELRKSQKTLFENFINDTHREKAPSNKTRAIVKSANMGI